jgi:hypothetical protein
MRVPPCTTTRLAARPATWIAAQSAAQGAGATQRTWLRTAQPSHEKLSARPRRRKTTSWKRATRETAAAQAVRIVHTCTRTARSPLRELK